MVSAADWRKSARRVVQNLLLRGYGREFQVLAFSGTHSGFDPEWNGAGHEPASESVRQRELRGPFQDAEARRDLRHRVRELNDENQRDELRNETSRGKL